MKTTVSNNGKKETIVTFSQCNFQGLRSVSCKNLTIFLNNEPEAHEEEKIIPLLYFTLQRTNEIGNSDEEELYSSENVPYSQNPTWSNFNLKKSCIQTTVIVRLWISQQNGYLPALQWNISDSQVFCIGEQLLGDTFQFNSNSVVIGVNNLYFVPKSCIVQTTLTDTATLLPTYDFGNPLKSYSKFSLSRIVSLKNKIENLKFFNEVVQKKIVLNLKNHHNLNELQLKQEKCRHKLLHLERLFKREKIMLDNQHAKKLKLQSSVEKLKDEINQNKVEDEDVSKIQDEFTTEMLAKVNKLNTMRAQLKLKQIKMLNELRLIFPITTDLIPTKQKKKNENSKEVKTYKICEVVLPSLETINNSKSELTQLAVALGFSCQLFIMFSRITQTPIRYPLLFLGSASNIYDNFRINNERSNVFPLHLKDTKNVTRGNFLYGLQLMRKSISQMMFFYKITKRSSCILNSLNLLITERINQLSEPSYYRKSEPINIMNNNENGRLSNENSSINSFYSDTASLSSTTSTIRTSSTRSAEPVTKKTHESHQSNYQWNRTELFKSSKRQPTKRSSTITTTVHRSSIVDKNVPNDRHVSDPVHFYQDAAAKKENNLLTGLESLKVKINKHSSKNLSAEEKRALLFGKNTRKGKLKFPSSGHQYKNNKLYSSDEDLA